MNPSTSVGSTATVALSTAGGSAVLLWAFACIHQGMLVVPDQTTALVMTAGLAPIAHAVRNMVVAWLASKAAKLPAPAPVAAQ